MRRILGEFRKNNFSAALADVKKLSQTRADPISPHSQYRPNNKLESLKHGSMKDQCIDL